MVLLPSFVWIAWWNVDLPISASWRRVTHYSVVVAEASNYSKFLKEMFLLYYVHIDIFIMSGIRSHNSMSPVAKELICNGDSRVKCQTYLSSLRKLPDVVLYVCIIHNTYLYIHKYICDYLKRYILNSLLRLFNASES